MKIKEEYIKRIKEIIRVDKYMDLYGFETIEEFIEHFIEDEIINVEKELNIDKKDSGGDVKMENKSIIEEIHKMDIDQLRTYCLNLIKENAPFVLINKKINKLYNYLRLQNIELDGLDSKGLDKYLKEHNVMIYLEKDIKTFIEEVKSEINKLAIDDKKEFTMMAVWSIIDDKSGGL